ncbi:MAG: DUF3108 domain-containing protein [Spirochaetes bacterium]|nr:DUF3108 domain-containing protein [Spirochaetota bacterium]
MDRSLLFFLGLLGALCQAAPFPIAVGERLYYQIRVKGILAGEQTTVVTNRERVDGVETWHLHSVTRSTGWVRSLYRLDDTFEAWIDTNRLLPVRARRSLREGGWASDFDLAFDAVRRCVRYTPRGASAPSRTDAMEENTVELLSLIYHLRGQTLAPGGVWRCAFWDYRGSSPFQVTLHEGRPVADIFGGSTNAVRTILVDENLGPRIQIALAPDYGNVPVRVTLPVFQVWKIGSIDVDGLLVEFRRGQ